MKDLVIKVQKNGSVKVKISDRLLEEEFNEIKDLYNLEDGDISLYKSDALVFILSECLRAWIAGFKCEAKNDYFIQINDLDLHVIDGEYEQDIEVDSEDMVEVGDDFGQIEN